MNRIRTILTSRALVVGVVLSLAGVATAVAGYLAAAAADSGRMEAEAAIAEIEDEVAEAETDLADADAAREMASRDETQAKMELAATEDERDGLQVELGTLEDQAPGFIDAAVDLVGSAQETQAALAGLAALRRGQADALVAGDYPGFNDQTHSYTEPAGQAAVQLADFFALAESLPAVSLRDPYEYDGPPGEAMASGEPIPLDPPTGPAVVAMTLPEEIPCQPWGNDGCRYSWEATIEESNWLEITITRLGVRYRGGGGYCIVGDEWADVTRVVAPNGHTTWSGWLNEDRDGECAPVLGGDVLVRWEGTDAEGNDLSGRATAELAPPP